MPAKSREHDERRSASFPHVFGWNLYDGIQFNDKTYHSLLLPVMLEDDSQPEFFLIGQNVETL